MDFAFLVHARDYTDIQKKFKIAKYLPRKLVEFWCLHWPPIIVSKVTGLKSQTAEHEVCGWIIGVPLTARQMIENRHLAQKRIVAAIKKAEKLGAKIVGLGALTSSVTRGGLDVQDKVKAIVTNGHVYTTHIVASTAENAAAKLGLDIKNECVAVVGAAGSVGYGSALILAKRGVKKFILVDIERKNKRLKELEAEIQSISPDIFIETTHQLNKIKNAGIVITATNSPEAVICPEDLKRGAIIVDDAQPSDISPEVKKGRPDVLILDGGIVHTPNIKNNFNFGLAEKENNYCCMAEAMILAANRWHDKNCLGYTDTDNVEIMAEAGKKLGFCVGAFQQSGKKYSDETLHAFKKYLK